MTVLLRSKCALTSFFHMQQTTRSHWIAVKSGACLTFEENVMARLHTDQAKQE